MATEAQLRLPLPDVPVEAPRISPAMLLLGRTEVARCRAILAAVTEVQTPPADGHRGSNL